MVIYQKLLPRTKKRGVFYLSLKISSLNRLASYDEYPPCISNPLFVPSGVLLAGYEGNGVLTLQRGGVHEVDGAVDAGAHTHLAHVAQALRQTWRQAHHVVLETTTTTTT